MNKIEHAISIIQDKNACFLVKDKSNGSKYWYVFCPCVDDEHMKNFTKVLDGRMSHEGKDQGFSVGYFDGDFRQNIRKYKTKFKYEELSRQDAIHIIIESTSITHEMLNHIPQKTKDVIEKPVTKKGLREAFIKRLMGN